MAFCENISSPVSNSDKTTIPLSDYAKKLDVKVKERYIKKISMIGIDPVLIEGKLFAPDCLPPVESTDLLCYLVLETSFYSQKQFKAFRSLEAFNQMVSGFISSVQGCMIANKFVVVAKVRHSQRMNDALIPIWIITDKNGVINCAHCLGCKAGLAESCSHVASVLFYLEAWTKIHGRLSCTQMKCSWILPSFANRVEYARVCDINFKSAKKMKVDLDESIENVAGNHPDFGDISNLSENTARTPNVPEPTEEEMETFISELSKGKTKPVVLSLISEYAESYVLPSRKIPTVMDLFKKENLKLPYHELIKVCHNTSIQITKEQINQVEKDTIEQSSGTNFFKHRAGRIGASLSKAASHSDPALPSLSLIQKICYPELNKITTKAVLHGCKHESSAISAFEEYMKKHHVDYKLRRCGLFINQQHPWMHATPDFLCSCDCCGEGCGEVKCPHCIENCDFDSYVLKPSSCLNKNSDGQYELSKEHAYFYQVQQQLFTTKRSYCDFVVFAIGCNKTSLISQRIYVSEDHWSRVLPKLHKFWEICILPEVLARWYTQRVHLIDTVQQTNAVCYCRKGLDEDTVKCCNPSCPIQQFHLSCLDIDHIPKTWYCPNCRVLPQFKRGSKKKISSNITEALKISSICTCKSVPGKEDKLVKCANVNCADGKFFHLSCLGRKRMPNNIDNWLCPACMNTSTQNPAKCAVTANTKPTTNHVKTIIKPAVTHVRTKTNSAVTHASANTKPAVTHYRTNTKPTVIIDTKPKIANTVTVPYVTTNTKPITAQSTTNTKSVASQNNNGVEVCQNCLSH